MAGAHFFPDRKKIAKLLILEAKPQNAHFHSRRQNQAEQSITFVEIEHAMGSARDASLINISFFKGIFARPKVIPE
ncbi:MAG: hypothetical protein DMF04_11950 [Verrucomicrobia bacterium]|nr:MAG: hypothetical protein DMF04_11950 [Verrucomicrobiota bacterium]